MISTELFSNINDHLLQDEMPSIYFNQIYYETYFQKTPFDMLYKLKQTEQSPIHHPEGNVWKHTMLVVDEASKLKVKSKDARVLMWAALLHDIGKPATTKNKNGKISAHNHDKIGAELSEEFLQKLTEDNKFINSVKVLVRWHMQILFVANNLPFEEIIKMKEQTDYQEVALLGFADRLGRTNVNKLKEEQNIKMFIQKCK